MKLVKFSIKIIAQIFLSLGKIGEFLDKISELLETAFPAENDE